MAVTLDKAPKLLFFLAIVTNPGTGTTQVHRLTLTPGDLTYDDLVIEMHAEKDAIEGAELICVIAGDRSEGYAEARKGETSNELFGQWLDQERLASGL
ncbi:MULTISPECIES: hypothetical protein [unclassified Streptomyces]|uniref:hypothetical protein n=1 Tax=unclassified Streptomyces TaxID=2593676 RepID=UPI0022578D8E|nr:MULTISPECIES: hypothetical protein [unclassified Streptomyces]MCX4976512.1 hypothetical protein [Streptomyces sp. NBC_00620]WRZ24381.1 hypothetical protein OHT59_40635 [Streptomyces sp. NBC_00243]